MRSLSFFLVAIVMLCVFSCKSSQPKPSASVKPRPIPDKTLRATPQPAVLEASSSKPATPEKAKTINYHLAEYAQKHVGLSYKYAGNSPKEGFDCSGFTCFVYREADISLPRSSRLQAEVGTPVPLEDLQAGDLLFFKNGSGRIFHVAFVHSVTENYYTVVHATSRGVTMDRSDSNAWDNYWRKRVAFARRVLVP